MRKHLELIQATLKYEVRLLHCYWRLETAHGAGFDAEEWFLTVGQSRCIKHSQNLRFRLCSQNTCEMLKEFCGFIDSATCTKLFFNFPNVLAAIPYFYGPAKHYSSSQRRAVITCCAWLSRFLYQLHVVWHAYFSIPQVNVIAPEPSSLVLLHASPCSVTSQGQPEAWERSLSLLLVTVASDPAL